MEITTVCSTIERNDYHTLSGFFVFVRSTLVIVRGLSCITDKPVTIKQGNCVLQPFLLATE